LDISVVPDFIAIGGLVTVFASVLKRTRQTRLRYWLLGWVLILAHIVAQLVNRNAGPGAVLDAALAVSLSTLLLASVAFVWAGNDLQLARSRALSLSLLAAAPDVALFCFASYGVASTSVYLACTAMGMAAALQVFRAGRRRAERGNAQWRTLAIVVVYGVQAALVVRASIDAVLVWVLFWHYLAVAFLFYRGAPRVTVGVLFTTISFVGWAAVFPVAYAFASWLPLLHIENEAWNLPKFLVATGMVFTLLEEQIGLAKHASMHDALTGLPNRRVFVRHLEAALARAKEVSGRVAVLVIDLDDFKRVNDTLGHAAGDVLLQFVAERLQANMRAGDTLARLGGDEFAAILPDVPDRAIAERLAQELATAARVGTEFQGHRLAIDASVGLSLYPDDGLDETRLYALADRAMYASKLAQRQDDGDLAGAS
jgi:diguanylate cyclase